MPQFVALAMRPIAGTSSRRRSPRSPTRRSCCLPTSLVPMASGSPRRHVTIWRRSSLVKAIRHSRTAYPTT